jgi:uncharacterized protein
MSPAYPASTHSTRTIAVITGASSGIGEVFARKLAPRHDLILVARRKERLDAIAAEISRAHGARVEVLAADLAEERGLSEVAGRIAAEPKLELLINNAGFGVRQLFWQSDLETQERMHRLHVMATVRLCHAALGNLVPKNRGGVINVASVAAFARSAGSSGYCATKSWMTAFTEGLYLELRAVKSAVVVQALCPGFTYSEFHDTMKVSRYDMAPRSFWLPAEKVVDAGLDGLRRGRLFVVPGWRYRVIAAVVTRLPVWARLGLESMRS